MSVLDRSKAWRDFRFGRVSKIVGASGDNFPGLTPDKDQLGRPRPLDFEHFNTVDFKLNDEAEEYS